jgi:hypothetical protein
MHLTANARIENWQRILIFALSGIAIIIAARSIVSGWYIPFLFLLFSIGILFLFFKYREAFILLILIINEGFFSLVPRDPLGKYQYQGLLYVVLILTFFWYFLREKKEVKAHFKTIILVFLILVGLGVANSFFQGQPLILGLKAARGYYLILFYFAFIEKKIDTSKLYMFIIIAGLGLAVLNNVQYISYGKLNLFHFSGEMLRVGRLRFLVGDFFTIFSPLIALSEYLKKKKKIFLFAYIYMISTVIIQGMTRAVIFGIFFTTLLMLFLVKRMNVFKALFLGIPVLTLMIWIIPFVQSTFLGELFILTKSEVSTGGGNIGIRLNTYDYYLKEIKKSPILGRGIWNEAYDIYMGDNPEDVRYKGLHLSDIGITSLVFHMGLLGAAWLIWLLAKIYRYVFSGRFRIKSNIDPGLIGYFIFGLLTLPTLNAFTSNNTIIYLALVLSLLSQAKDSSPNAKA